MARQRLTAAVVGAGSGGQLSMNGLTASENYDFVAFADISATARQAIGERFPGVNAYASHLEMFSAQPTDVVCVSTWPPSHRQVTLSALEMVHPQGMLVEKPLGDTHVAGAAILDALEAARLPVVVPHGLLQLKHSRQIIERVRAGEIGELELVQIECNQWDIINAGIHWLNFFVNLVPDDPAAWVMAAEEHSTQTYRDGAQVETTAITYVQTRSGVRCVMETGDAVQIRRPGKGMLFRLFGTAGTIEFWAWESAYRLLNAQHPAGTLIEVTPWPQTHHQRYLDTLADQIANGTTDYVYPRSSLAALELCEAAYISAAQHCKVVLPLASFIAPHMPAWHPGQPYNGQGGRDGRKL